MKISQNKSRLVRARAGARAGVDVADEFFPSGIREAQKLRAALQLVALSGRELARFFEVERWPEGDAASRDASAKLDKALQHLKFARFAADSAKRRGR